MPATTRTRSVARVALALPLLAITAPIVHSALITFLKTLASITRFSFLSPLLCASRYILSRRVRPNESPDPRPQFHSRIVAAVGLAQQSMPPVMAVILCFIVMTSRFAIFYDLDCCPLCQPCLDESGLPLEVSLNLRPHPKSEAQALKPQVAHPSPNSRPSISSHDAVKMRRTEATSNDNRSISKSHGNKNGSHGKRQFRGLSNWFYTPYKL